jgi:hypothetical protein
MGIATAAMVGAGVAKCVTGTHRDGARRSGTDGHVVAGRRASGERACGTWDVSRCAHNPEVAGSNPAPATNASAVSPQVTGPQFTLAGL